MTLANLTLLWPPATLDPARPFGGAIVVPKLIADAGYRAARGRSSDGRARKPTHD
jgi:hypothetical protein